MLPITVQVKLIPEVLIEVDPGQVKVEDFKHLVRAMTPDERAKVVSAVYESVNAGLRTAGLLK